MKDEELNLEEIEVFHTPGGSWGVTRGQGSREGVDVTLLTETLKNINFVDGGIKYNMTGWVAVTDSQGVGSQVPCLLSDPVVLKPWKTGGNKLV